MIHVLLKSLLIGCSVFMFTIVADITFHKQVLIKDAQARVGRPLTPGSVAGVARRTTRRAIRRTTVYVAALPPSCTTVIIEGTTLHHCGTTYYQASGGKYYVVEIDDE